MNVMIFISVLITIAGCAIITALLYSFKKLSRRVTTKDFNKAIYSIEKKLIIIEERVNANMKKLESNVKEELNEVQDEVSNDLYDVDENIKSVKENIEEIIDRVVSNKLKTKTKRDNPNKFLNLPEVLKLHNEGKSHRKIEELTGIPKSTVSGWLIKNGNYE